MTSGEDGRLDEVAAGEVAVGRFAAGDARAPAPPCRCGCTRARAAAARCETSGPILVSGSRPWPSRTLAAISARRRDELVVDRLLDEQPRAGRADLALAEEDAHEHALERGVEVGVGEDDVGRLAAEFERDLLQVARPRPSRAARPTSVEPVKVILSTPSWCASAAPAVSP